MIMTYEDGTPVQPQIITSAATSFKQVTAVPITIGSHCDVNIYRIRHIIDIYLTKKFLITLFADARSQKKWLTDT